MLTIQVYTYYRRFPQDKVAYKVLVSEGLISGRADAYPKHNLVRLR